MGLLNHLRTPTMHGYGPMQVMEMQEGTSVRARSTAGGNKRKRAPAERTSPRGRPPKSPITDTTMTNADDTTSPAMEAAYENSSKSCQGNRKHKCLQCGKHFVSQSKLARHMLVHTKEKPWVCEGCGSRFTQKSALTVHCTRYLRAVKKTHDEAGRYSIRELACARGGGAKIHVVTAEVGRAENDMVSAKINFGHNSTSMLSW